MKKTTIVSYVFTVFSLIAFIVGWVYAMEAIFISLILAFLAVTVGYVGDCKGRDTSTIISLVLGGILLMLCMLSMAVLFLLVRG